MTAKKFKDSNDGKLSYRAPKHLSPLASACWRKTVPFLEEQKPVDKIDSFLVEMYCTQYEIYRNSYEHLKKHGEVQEIYKPVQDMTQIYSDAIKNLTKIGSELGLSPKSRSELMGLNMQEDEEEIDWTSKFGGG